MNNLCPFTVHASEIAHQFKSFQFLVLVLAAVQYHYTLHLCKLPLSAHFKIGEETTVNLSIKCR